MADQNREIDDCVSEKRKVQKLEDDGPKEDEKLDPVADTGGGEAENDKPDEPETKTEKEAVSFKVVYSKQKYDVTFPLDDTVAALKEHIQTFTEVEPSMQKLMYKGLAKDESTLRELKVTNGAKLMLVGSTKSAVQSVAKPDLKAVQDDSDAASASKKEPLCQQKNHKKVLEKYGKPEDIIAGSKRREALPPAPISGMYNKFGGKVRLTFKMEMDQLWIGTKERTEKINMASIRNVVSEPLEGHEEYHIMGFQLGPTEASRYWVYWVPAQYVDAIKDAVLGKFQYF